MNAFSIVIRPDYLEICEGDHCAAAILHLLKRWAAKKLREGVSEWIYKSQPELCRDLLGLFGLNKVAAALHKLRAWGYLLHRTNPHNGQDKTLQYKVNEEAIAECLALLSGASDVKNEGLEPPKQEFEALKLKSQAPKLTVSESMNQSLISSGISSEESSSSPTHHPDDDLPHFKFFQSIFKPIEPEQLEQLRGHYRHFGAARFATVMERCEAYNARTWGYILEAFGREMRLESHEPTSRNEASESSGRDETPIPPTPLPQSDEETEPDATEPPDERVSPEDRKAWEMFLQLFEPYDRISCNDWLRPARLVKTEGDCWTIETPTQYAADFLKYRMLRGMEWLVNSAAGRAIELRFEAREARAG